jgi:hypothetical protein
VVLLREGYPNGSSFLVNVHEIDAGRDYSVASTRHARIDDATEGELEHDIPHSETLLCCFHEMDTAQTGLCQRMVVGELQDRHRRATPWLRGIARTILERVNAVTVHERRGGGRAIDEGVLIMPKQQVAPPQSRTT